MKIFPSIINKAFLKYYCPLTQCVPFKVTVPNKLTCYWQPIADQDRLWSFCTVQFIGRCESMSRKSHVLLELDTVELVSTDHWMVWINKWCNINHESTGCFSYFSDGQHQSVENTQTLTWWDDSGSDTQLVTRIGLTFISFSRNGIFYNILGIYKQI